MSDAPLTTPSATRSWMAGWGGLVAFIVVCQLAGVLGALTTETGSSTWYAKLEKPAFQPPGWVFGPVWISLYSLMGIAAWRVFRLGLDTPGVRSALKAFWVQLLLNAIWSPVFFGFHAVAIALGILVALLAVLAKTLMAFRTLDGPAGWMLVPYLLWVSFATVLNGAIAWLNGPRP